MPAQINTTCIRCGKVRIFLKRWKDKENNRGNMVTHVTTVCPDEACQKEVDAKFQEMRDRRNLAEERRKSKQNKPKAAAAAVVVN